ncbi:hypothetical protein RI845_00965 [Thalassotalea nanhaiensis]|uniref:4Fe-4S ferredoxin-type domain-containing protein n=1 Tax=Thalassotalea nanhaiensis TaxID=3065648 RepID=A0ABY9TIS5_9GAMM|nr:hypothetical protein RI845_00965 [Colwelliaceae bacterium SQ345]
MKILTDKLIVDAVNCLWCVDACPPTTERVVKEIHHFDLKRVRGALERAAERGKLISSNGYWTPTRKGI